MLAFALATALAAAPICGHERWAVKTLSDYGTKFLAVEHPPTAYVRELIQIPSNHVAHPTNKAWGMPRQQVETMVVTVDAVVRGYKREADGDIHVVIADLDKAYGPTMIAEFPDDSCLAKTFKKYIPAITAARVQMVRALPYTVTDKYRAVPPIRVKLTGVLFFDRPHKQTGVAPNAIELHPVLKVEKP